MRLCRSYEDTEKGRIFGVEALCLGSYSGWGYLEIRWRSAEDGRTPMLWVQLRLFKHTIIDRYLWKPKPCNTKTTN